MSKKLFDSFISDCKFASKSVKHAKWWNDACEDSWEEILWSTINEITEFMKQKYPKVNKKKLEDFLYKESQKAA